MRDEYCQFKFGDKVTSTFYHKDRKIIRTVIAIKFHPTSESGWFVVTRDDQGRMLDCDSHWYRKVEDHA